MGELTHAFVPCDAASTGTGRPSEVCIAEVPDGAYSGLCGLPRSAHPASPPEPAPERWFCKAHNAERCATCVEDIYSVPEPAPESEEPRLEPQKCSHGVPVFVPCAQCQYAPTAGAGGILGMPAPARPEPPSLRRMARRAAQELFTRCEHRGSKTISETIDLPCIECGELRLTRLLESVVRECADEAGTYRGSVMLRRRGLSPESAPEPK